MLRTSSSCSGPRGTDHGLRKSQKHGLHTQRNYHNPRRTSRHCRPDSGTSFLLTTANMRCHWSCATERTGRTNVEWTAMGGCRFHLRRHRAGTRPIHNAIGVLLVACVLFRFEHRRGATTWHAGNDERVRGKGLRVRSCLGLGAGMPGSGLFCRLVYNLVRRNGARLRVVRESCWVVEEDVGLWGGRLAETKAYFR